MTAKSPRQRPPQQESRLSSDGQHSEPIAALGAIRWRIAILSCLGLALSVLVVSTMGVASLSEASSEPFLGLAVESPTALVERADNELAQNRQAISLSSNLGVASGERIEKFVKRALQTDVFQASAWRILGELSDSRGDAALAANYMRAALARSQHESQAAYWLLRDSARRRDFASAAGYADILLRTRGGSGPEVVPVLAQLAEEEAGRRALVQLLATNPPWRGVFFDQLPRSSSDQRVPFWIFAALKDGANPPNNSEMKLYLENLCRHGLYEFAYYVWLQLSPAEQFNEAALLNNGGFDAATSGLPFDWTWAKGAGASIAIESPPDRTGRALHVEMGVGRIVLDGVRQVTVLAPGSYRLSGQYLGDVRADRGLVWKILCAGTQAPPLAQTGMFNKPSAAWLPFSVDFEVPAIGCSGQVVGLFLDARFQAERLISGGLWFDNLQITPLTDDAASRLSPGAVARSGSGIF